MNIKGAIFDLDGTIIRFGSVASVGLPRFGYETDERGSLGKHSERIRWMIQRGSAFRSGRKNQVSHANADFFGHRKAARSDTRRSRPSSPAPRNITLDKFTIKCYI